MERKLVAILAADVVGYSALMERDETGTFERLRANHKELFEPTVERHRGRIFKVMGDGVLAEFGSVVDAVECAVFLQSGLAERAEKLPPEQRILVRVGINLGEVIVEGEDRYGEGVNVAARLQALAEVGGICVSGKVAKEVEKKLNFVFEAMGEQRVKNIEEPIAIYRVRAGGSQRSKTRRRSYIRALNSGAAHRLRDTAILAIAALTIIGGAALWRRNSQPLEISGPPTIAVLPLTNMSGDPTLKYFADGATENLIGNLARSPQIKVIARTSTDAYKGKAVDIRQIGKELGARYVLEGSVQKSADKVRIVAQLIDARDGEHVWAERFDRQGADPLALQDEVTENIVGTLAGDTGIIKKKQYEEEWGKDTAQLDEWDYYLRGHEYFVHYDKETNYKAVAIWEEGLRKYPDSALLKVKLGWAYYQRWFNGYSADPQGDSRMTVKFAQEVMAAQRAPPLALALGHWLAGYVSGDIEGDYLRAVRELKTAIVLLPTEMDPKLNLSFYLLGAGKIDEAIASLDFLGVDGKTNPALGAGFCNKGFAHFIKYEYDKVVDDLTDVAGINANCLSILAAGYVQLGNVAEAKSTVQKARTLDPQYSVELFRRGNNIPDKKALGRLTDSMRQAGLPET